MYAVVKVGSTQYKVSEGDTIAANHLDKKAGSKLDLDVLLYAKGNEVRVGQPLLTDVKVSAKVVKDFRGDKVIAFKYRRRKDSSTKKGHRQDLTALQIEKIAA